MRHRKHTFKIGRTSSHRRCLMANMLKDLILRGRIETTVRKAKELRRYADRMITIAKGGTLADRRRAIALLMVRYNTLSTKEARQAKGGDKSSYNGDRVVIEKLFGEIAPRFSERQGGYTRIVRTRARLGDNSEQCVIEYVA